MNNYTSLELSKKLKEGGCELESEYSWQLNPKGWLLIETESIIEENAVYPAYDILNDICVKYADKFFIGKNDLNLKKGWKFCSACGCMVEGYRYHALVVYSYMAQNKKKEAEDYIWEHCLFNPKKKEITMGLET